MIDNDLSFDEDDFDDILNTTPTELINAAEEICRASLLPEKSRVRYERQFDVFQKWRHDQKTNSSSERILLAFFGAMSKDNKKPSTMWAYYSMLKCMLKLHENVDISEYAKLKNFLKRKNDGYQPTKAKTFTEEQMKTFISQASNDTWLAIKVS